MDIKREIIESVTSTFIRLLADDDAAKENYDIHKSTDTRLLFFNESCKRQYYERLKTEAASGTHFDNLIYPEQNTDFRAAKFQVKETEEMPPIWENITVKTRKNGLFEYRFTHKGKRNSVYGRSKKECWENREQIIAGKQSKSKKSPQSYTFGEWLKKWYEVWHLANHKGNKKYNWVMEHYGKVISAKLGKIPLKQLSGGDIQEFLAVQTKGVLYKCHFIIKSSLNVAFNEGIIKRNPFNSVTLKKPKKESYKALTIAEQRFVYDNIRIEKYRVFFMYACCTGMRLTEAFNAIPNIDYDRGIINVVDKDTDKKKHRRQIPFLPELLGEKERIMLGELNKTATQGYFKGLFKRLDMRGGYCVHSFRHTFASCCYHIGIKDKQIQSWLGHTQFATTMNVYTSLLHNDGSSPILDYLSKLKMYLGI
jgi:integrase